MLNHITVRVSNLAKTVDFYDQLMAALEYEPISYEEGLAVAYGKYTSEVIFLQSNQKNAVAPNTLELAFNAYERKNVDQFFDTALSLGAPIIINPSIDNNIGPNYYHCIIKDPNGIEVEAVYLTE